MTGSVSFAIAGWSAWAPGLDAPAAWRGWARAHGEPPSSARADFAGGASPAIRELPALLARRASRGARAGLRAALDCTRGLAGPVKTVFASRHGEVARSVELLEALARGEPLSPMAFSLSVHNAAAGLFSIGRGDRAASSSVTAGRDSVPMAVLEACGVLAEGASHVLVVAHDEPVPAPFQRYVAEPSAYVGAAFLLEAAGPKPFVLERSAPALPLCGPDEGHLVTLLRLLLDEEVAETSTEHCTRSWRWRRSS
jgi:beta-ketoacyl synthase-like protein